MNEKIKHNGSPSIKVGRFLRLKGFYLASPNGLALGSLIDKRVLDVLCNDPKAKPKERRWFGIVAQKSRRVFLGLVFFKDKSRSADINNWIFEVYEKEHIESAKQLTEEMSLFFKVKINLRFADKKPRV